MLRLVSGLICLLLALATSATTGAIAQAPSVKIGLLLPYTGVLSVAGIDATNGLSLYLKKVGGRAGGRAISLLKEDDEAIPDVGLTKVKKLVERDRVDFLVETVSSVVALAIRNYVHDSGVPTVIPVAFTRVLTSPKVASPNVFRIAETTDQSDFPMGAWMINHTRYRKVFVMATDFVAGHQAVEAFIAGFRAAGGTIVKEIYAPLGTPDFAPYLTQAAATPADAVYAWFAGTDAIRFEKQYKEYGLWDHMPLTGHGVLSDDTILPAIGDASLGIITMSSYSAAIDTPVNKAFVREYEQAHKTWPSRYSEAGWITAQLITQALDSLQGDLSDRGRVREALRNAITRIKAPRGQMMFDRYNQIICHIIVTKTEKQGGRYINAVLTTLPLTSQESVWGWWNKP